MKWHSFLWLTPFTTFALGYLLVRFFLHVPELATPHLVGTDIHTAALMLSNHNLNLRITQQKEDADLPHGTIMSQNPEARTAIKPRQSVYVCVSQRPPIACAPHCLGKPTAEIAQELKKLNLKGRIFMLENPGLHETCFAQIPNPNQPLEDKNMIIYAAKNNFRLIIWPSLIGKPVAQVKEFLANQAIEAQITHHPQAQPDHTCHTCCVVDQRPLPGSIIPLNTAHPPYVQLRVA